MNLHVQGRPGREGAAGRLKGTRIAVALLATAALCLGPAMAASAEEPGVSSADTTAQAESAGAADAITEVVAASTEVSDSSEAAQSDDTADDSPTGTSGSDDTPEAAVEATNDSTEAGSPEGTTGTNESDSTEPADDSSDDAAANAETDENAATDASVSEAPTSAARAAAPAPLSLQGKDDGNHGHQGIGICHATSSDSNPYVFLPNVDVDSIFKKQGHDQHTKANGTRSDVIPAFWYVKNGNKHEYTYPGNGAYYPGKNLDATGEYMLDHKCATPPEPPQPPVVLTVGARDCLDPVNEDEVQLKAIIGNLTVGEEYSVVLTELPSTPVDSPYVFTASSVTQQLSWWVTSAGSYRITATGPGDLSASADTTVANCPDVPPEVVVPSINLYYDDICAPRVAEVQLAAESTLYVELDDLMEGDEYEVTGTGPDGYTYNQTLTADASGAAEIALTGLLPGFYQFTVTGPEGDTQSSQDSVVVTNYCPPEPEEPTIEVNPGSCVIPGEEQVEIEAPQLMATQSSLTEIFGSNLVPGDDYVVEVTDSWGTVFSDYFEADETGHIYAVVTIYWPGSYTAFITELGGEPLSVSQDFDVSECPPVVPTLTVTVLPCPGNDPALPLQAKLQAADLQPGETYAISATGPSGFVWNGSLTGSEAGTAEITVTLAANGAYTASLEGASAGTEFTAAKSCTPKTVTPVGGPALPSTGSGDLQPLLWGGVLAMLVATGLLLQPLRTRRMKR